MYCQKVCLIGASAVGKTSLVRHFVDGIFADKYLTTIGVKIDKHQVVTKQGEVQLLIWDIEGTDRFCGFNTRYLNGANAYIVVLDKSRPKSAVDALTLLSMAKDYSDAPAYLAINKSDLNGQLSQDLHAQLQSAGFAQVINTSAKTGENVEQLFRSIAEQEVVR
ncbi:Rab family GTPase [Thalassotalea euphylliae]|uniref:GTP-binding protein n=1 Tax=Thalassotalea euphylliae TaxID=1655234 RepID=A0A3E0UCP5_9GAMM|nr:Rab family GTPase [Thalassotalea euphylliae]REL34666.1 GTP-binding protein [Thalassotalea euphylliae]